VDLELSGRKAIVTGGTRGIGRAIARALALEGVDVVVVGRDEARLTATARELAAETGREITPLICDTASSDQVRTMVAAAVDALGGVDILVNSAAEAATQPTPVTLADIDDELFWADVNVKVAGYLRCIREVAPHMAAGGGGRIINISGLNARMTGSTIGSIRNVGVAALTKTLADELAPQGIGLVVVHPGVTRTERTPERFTAHAALAGVSPDEIERRMGASNLLGRVVDASEVAHVVAFLASPKAVSINGDAIAVGGGTPGPIHY
jgi:NAD(P)-dependent dehydrogenase (short-subunit alcohol dehydrogenase family)